MTPSRNEDVDLSTTGACSRTTRATRKRAAAAPQWQSARTGLRVWIASPEDFMVSKLARPDRGVSDEQDVKSVMERDGVCIDWCYLEERAERAGVGALLKTIRDK